MPAWLAAAAGAYLLVALASPSTSWLSEPPSVRAVAFDDADVPVDD